MFNIVARRRLAATLLLTLLLTACGASSQPAAAPASEVDSPSATTAPRPTSASGAEPESPVAEAPGEGSSGAGRPPSGGSSPWSALDWEATIKADPRLEVETLDDRIYVMVREAAPPVGGHPLLDDIVYVDMDGGGVEEAAIPLSSGGTAGNVGALIYALSDGVPALVAWTDGYKLGLKVEDGRLVVHNAFYAGWEPNCCPSGIGYDTYVLEGGALKRLEHRDEGFVEAQAPTVEQFYSLIRNKELAAAYAMLSKSEQAANPYGSWSAGFANTLGVEATVTPDAERPNTVRVELASTDQGADGTQVVRRYSGTWQLEWDAERAWVLTNPEISELPGS